MRAARLVRATVAITLGASSDQLLPAGNGHDHRLSAEGDDAPKLRDLYHDRQDVAAADRRASAHRDASTRRAPVSDRGRRPVGVVAADDGDVRVEQLADLRGDGIEDLGRRSVA